MSEINLIPIQGSYNKRRMNKKIIVTIFLLIVILIISITNIHLLYIRGNYDDIELKSNNLEAKVMEVSAMEQRVAELDEKIAELSIINRPEVGGLISYTYSEVPEGIVLNEISGNKSEVSLEGHGRNLVLVGAYINKLELSDFTNDASLQGIERNKINTREVISFIIICDIEPEE